MTKRLVVAGLMTAMMVGCGGKEESPKKGKAPKKAAAPTVRKAVDYSKPALLTDESMKTLCACANEMKAANVDPMPSKKDDPGAMDAMASPVALGAMFDKEPKGKAILDKHGMDGPTFAHQMLTAAAVMSVAAKAKDWPDYQKKAKAMKAEMAASTAMMKGFMQAGLQNLKGEEKAKKQKEMDQAIKSLEKMMTMMADYAGQSPQQNYDLVVKYKDDLGALKPDKAAKK